MTKPVLKSRFVSIDAFVGQTLLAYDFELSQPDGLTLIRLRAGERVKLDLGLHYAFPAGLGTPAGGTLTLLSPAIAGDVYLLIGTLPEVRISDFLGTQAFQAEKFNGDLDHLTIVAMEHRRDIERSIRVDYGRSAPMLGDYDQGEALLVGPDNTLIGGPTADEIEHAQEYAERAEAAAAATAQSGNSFTFATKALAEAFRPVTRPPYIRTIFLDTDATPYSGAKYKPNGLATGDITITSKDGLTTWGFDVTGNLVSASTFGLKASNSAAVNKAILKAAALRTPTRGTLFIPDVGGTVLVDTSLGFSDAILIDREITVLNRADLKMTYGVYEPNPAYMFRFIASYSMFINRGTLRGSGNIVIAPPAGTTAQMPGLIHVAGIEGFNFNGGKVIQQPCTAIMLAGSACKWARITGTNFIGGPATFHFSFLAPDYVTPDPGYVGSAYFGVVATGGGHHEFASLNFLKDTDDGRVINGIFTSGLNGNSNYNQTKRCRAQEPWEKLLYGYGDGQDIGGNFIYGAYGAAHTEAIRAWGANNRIHDNYIDLCRGGIQVLDGSGNKIYNNDILRCRATGVSIQDFSPGYVSGIDFSEVYGNKITRDGSAPEKRFAIRILNIKSDNSVITNIVGCVVRNNLISGFGDAGSGSSQEIEYAVQVQAGAPYNADKPIIEGNSLTSCPNGIVLRRANGGVIYGNHINAGTFLGINVVGGADITTMANTGKSPGAYFLSIDATDPPTGSRFLYNSCRGAGNIAIRNFTFGTNNNWADGNQWTSAPLNFQFALAAVVTTTVAHGGVAAHARISLDPVNDAFGVLLANAGLRASSNGANFDVRMVNGEAAAGGEQGMAYIHQ